MQNYCKRAVFPHYTLSSYFYVFLYIFSLGDKDGRGVDVHRLKIQLKTIGETTLVEKLESAEKATVNASEVNQSDDTMRISSLG
jgi:hypothetical protein